MSDTALLFVAGAALVAFLGAVAALLHGWRVWLALKQAELSHVPAGAPITPTPANRIALADLKERVRRLESIANGDA